ncbi:RNA-binding ATPase activator esf2 [Aspergillus hancockii]|nr:RNA-binding ATPase activator esf2 [Aspergillus hancockii]
MEQVADSRSARRPTTGDAKTVVAPLDRVKILFQASNPQFAKYTGSWFGLVSAVRDIKRHEGPRGLYKGHSATLLRIFPYAAIKFLAYEQIRGAIIPSREKETPFRRLISGSLAGITSVFFTYPLELIRVRLAFETKRSSRSSFADIFRQIYRERVSAPSAPNPSTSAAATATAEVSSAVNKVVPSSGLANFYRGFGPTLLGMLPYAGMSFLTHDTVGDWLRSPALSQYTIIPGSESKSKKGSGRAQLTAAAELFSGALAGLVSQTSAYPLEVPERPQDFVSDDEEDNDRGYDSEAAEESKGRLMKRRRTQLQNDHSDNFADNDNNSDSDLKISKAKGSKKSKQTAELNEDHDDESADDLDQYLDVAAHETKKTKPIIDKSKPAKKKKTGVVYLSSLPPYMKPFALKSLIEARGFAPVTKVFLTPLVKSSSGPRKTSNKRKMFTDGWVEFASKKTAKLCAETLNASIVGGRKGGWYHDDVLCMKYLKGFRWSDLIETVARERSEREAKQRIEDTRARKEDKIFLQGVETGKVLDGMQKKSEEKRKRQMETGDTGGKPLADFKVRRTFKQNEVKRGRDTLKDGEVSLEADTKRVLGKIF